jgi:hypothetical protein
MRAVLGWLGYLGGLAALGALVGVTTTAFIMKAAGL